MTSYTVDQAWIRPFAPIIKEPSVLSTSSLTLKPTESLKPETKTFTFEFPTLSEYFLDINSIQLFVKGKLVHKDLSELESGENVYLSNAPLYCLFSSVNLIFGENQEKIVYNDYPYLGLFQMVDKMTDNSRRMMMTGLVPDDGSDGRTKIRKDLVSKSNMVMFMGKIFADILNIDSYLLKNTPLTLQLVKSHADFYSCAEDDAKDYNFVIHEINLSITTIMPNMKLSLALEKQMQTTDAIYNFDHLILKKFYIPDNTYSYDIKRLWSGKLPRRFAFSTITQRSYQGSKGDDPMKFHLSNIKKITLKVNEIDIEAINLEEASFLSYHKMLQFLQSGDQTFITKGIYEHSLTFLCFDLNVLCDNNMSCVNELVPSGTLSIEISFKSSTPDPLILLMFSFNDAHLQIDNKRKCTITTNRS